MSMNMDEIFLLIDEAFDKERAEQEQMKLSGQESVQESGQESLIIKEIGGLK